MLHITIEMWPLGDREKAFPIAEAFIVNDGTGDQYTGSYMGVFGLTNGRVWKMVRNVRHSRIWNVWYVLGAVLDVARKQQKRITP